MTFIPPIRPPGNIPASVWARIGRNLHRNRSHPVGIVSGLIENHFAAAMHKIYTVPESPIVTRAQAFDNLLVPADHVLRSASDTYYVTEDTVLRPHATSHQKEVLSDLRKSGDRGAVWTCDVYRKDEVDRIHFPVFHQTDGVRLFDPCVSETEVLEDLEFSLESLIGNLFKKAGRNVDMRWDRAATFPFTNPSRELEIKLNNTWIECLGCGKIRSEIDPNGWAFGIGIDRLAMLLFEIDDIRTLWSQDERFLSQFSTSGEICKFKPFSKFPPTYRDVSFWLKTPDAVGVDQIFRTEALKLAGPLGLESVDLIDDFSRLGKRSLCFRLTYRGIEKTLTSEECNEIHSLVERFVEHTLDCEVRK